MLCIPVPPKKLATLGGLRLQPEACRRGGGPWCGPSLVFCHGQDEVGRRQGWDVLRLCSLGGLQKKAKSSGKVAWGVESWKFQSLFRSIITSPGEVPNSMFALTRTGIPCNSPLKLPQRKKEGLKKILYLLSIGLLECLDLHWTKKTFQVGLQLFTIM